MQLSHEDESCWLKILCQLEQTRISILLARAAMAPSVTPRSLPALRGTSGPAAPGTRRAIFLISDHDSQEASEEACCAEG